MRDQLLSNYDHVGVERDLDIDIEGVQDPLDTL